MKFAEHLQTHITSEWQKQYVNYREMKAMLISCIDQSPSAELVDPEVLARYFSKFDEQFFSFCDSELVKVNTFFSEKLSEAKRKFTELRSELTEAKNKGTAKEKSGRHKKSPSVRKVKELKFAFSEFYLSLILLQNYQNLNFTGFRKILKKHDKLLSKDFGAKWRVENVETAHFYTNKDIDRLIQETESVVTQEIEAGDRQKAMKRLRVPPFHEQQSPWTTFKVGLFSGSFIVLCVAVMITAQSQKPSKDWKSALRLYRAPFLVIQFLFLWSVNIYGWKTYGVNHVLVFELDPRNHLTEQHVMEIAALFGVVWCISLLCFFYSEVLSIPAYACPLILYILMFGFLINPLKVCRHEARFWTIRILIRVIFAPFFYVGFSDFFVADQLSSIVPAFHDLQYFFCFYATNDNLSEAGDSTYCTESPGMKALRTVLTVIPAWYRYAQCFRRFHDTKAAVHIYNAGKYFALFVAVLFSSIVFATSNKYEYATDNPFFYMWICASIVSSTYAYLWDLKMDWGLFKPDAGENKFLREQIVYPTWLYYFTIFEDFFIRFDWIIYSIFLELGYNKEILVTISAPFEVFRRFMWNFFRLENEHVNNCGNFRAVRDISVAPTDTSDQAIILRMMDEEDGVINRRSRRNDRGDQARLLLDSPDLHM